MASSQNDTDDADTRRSSTTAARIITHMNNDHQRDMALYLRHFASLPATHPDVYSPAQLSLAEITLAGMKIAASDSGRTYDIPFDPPMQSLSESRQRLVGMTEAARTSLGLAPAGGHHSTVQITRFPPNSLQDRIALAVIGFYAASLAAAPWMLPGTPLGDALDWAWAFGGGRQGYRSLCLWIAGPVAAIHAIEMVMLHLRFMRPYGVAAGSGLWWRWMADAAVQGGGALMRARREVRRLEAERGGEKKAQ
jgi:hypothetical protein